MALLTIKGLFTRHIHMAVRIPLTDMSVLTYYIALDKMRHFPTRDAGKSEVGASQVVEECVPEGVAAPGTISFNRSSISTIDISKG
jgi:hypothetical protein